MNGKAVGERMLEEEAGKQGPGADNGRAVFHT